MEKLPPTSYVRMVDIWLIFSQLVPFIEVLLITMMEFFSESENINHHGKLLNVDDDTNVSQTTRGVIKTIGKENNVE